MGPTRLGSLFQSVHHLGECLNLSSCFTGFLTNFSSCISVFTEGRNQNIGCHPLFLKNVVKVAGSVKCFSGQGLIHSIGGLRYSSEFQGGCDQLILELHGSHVGIFDGFPVDQLYITSRQCLGKVIHCSRCFIGVCTRDSCFITYTLDCLNGILQFNTGIRKFTDVLSHIGERINSLIGVFIQFLQISINCVQTFSGRSHNSLDGIHFELVFVEAGRYWFNSEHLSRPHGSLFNFVRDVTKGLVGDSIESIESQTDSINAVSKNTHVDFLNSRIHVFKTLSCS